MPSEPWCRAHISSTGQTSTEAISNQNVICCSGAELYTRITSLALNPIGDLRSSIFLVPARICLAYTGLMDRIAVGTASVQTAGFRLPKAPRHGFEPRYERSMWNVQGADFKIAEMDTMDTKTHHSYTTRTRRRDR